MEQNKNLEQYFSKDLFKINNLLHRIDELKTEIEYGHSHFICDIHGICEVTQQDDEDDSDIGSCFFCGTELRRVNGDWYHNTAFDDNNNLIDLTYQTHNYAGSQPGEPTTEEERELVEVQEQLAKYDHLKIKQFALLGNPVSHSRSPSIYNRLFKEAGMLHSYIAKEVNGIRDIANELKNFDGVNITYPFKEVAINLVDELSADAKEIGAINLIQRKNGKLIGFNTDGVGFANTIDKHYNKILILGAGSTAKAAALALKEDGNTVIVTNRSANSFQFFQDNGIPFYLHKDLPLEKYDLIVNMTSAGLDNDLLPMDKDILSQLIKLSSKGIDVIYNKKTPFLTLFEKCGKEYEDGSKMLLSQAEENFNVLF